MTDDKKVVTNIRMSRDEWIQAKTRAAELGVSLNEYFVSLSKRDATQTYLGDVQGKATEKKSLLDLPEIAQKIERKPMELSKDDEAIYGIDEYKK